MVVSNIFYFHPEPWGNDPFWLIFSDGLKPPTSYDLFRWTSYRLIANHEISSKLRLIDRGWNLISRSCQWLESHVPRCVACLGITGHDWTATGTLKSPMFFLDLISRPRIFPMRIRFPAIWLRAMYTKYVNKKESIRCLFNLLGWWVFVLVLFCVLLFSRDFWQEV